MKQLLILFARGWLASLVLCSVGFGFDVQWYEDAISFTPLFDAPEVQTIYDGNNVKALIKLNYPPDVNWWSYTIEDAGQFDYFYQAPFENAETFRRDGEQWLRCDRDGDGNIHERKSVIDGSWAVYHKTKWGNQYKNGKAFHIIADAWDSNGEHRRPHIWIEDGVYTVSVDSEWLDNANYPVVINDDWLGYKVAPASTTTTTSALLACGQWDGVNGTVNTFYIYATSSSSVKCTGGIYNTNEGTGKPNALIVDTGELTLANGYAYQSVAFDSAQLVNSTTDYWFAFHFATTAGFGYDDSQSPLSTRHATYTYVAGTLQASWVDNAASGTNRRIGSYVTYTPTAGGEIPSTTIFRRRRT